MPTALEKEQHFPPLVLLSGEPKKDAVTKMLSSDSKQLNNDINISPHDRGASNVFRDVCGPVTFRDEGIETASGFMKQLIEIKNEETPTLLA